MRNVLGRLTSDRRYIVRDVEGGALLERFFVSGVVALLLLRFYLELTGFPKVGGRGLHIAHMLWGGALMVTALIVLVAFLGGTARSLGATVGGIGFGIFIDELGKFITTDNNYFYQPAIALIYVIFVLLFLALRAIEREQVRSEQGYLVNALAATGEAVLHNYDRTNTARALALLRRVPEESPLAAALIQVLSTAAVSQVSRPGLIPRATAQMRHLYGRVVQAGWFARTVVIGFFAYAAITTLALALVVVAAGVHLLGGAASARADASFSLLSDALIVVGAVTWRRSRISGLRWFKRSILVTLLLVQPFLFYREQIAGVAWLGFDLLILGALNYMIGQEHLMSALAHGHDVDADGSEQEGRTDTAGALSSGT